MKLEHVIHKESIRINSSADDKAFALCEIAALAKESPVCAGVSEEAILEALQERETLGSTAFGNGIAIPHCRMKGVRDFLVGFVSVPKGVEFEARDKKKVQLLVFMIAPEGKKNTHIRLLSSISRAMQNLDVVEKMIYADSIDQLYETFLDAAGRDVSTDEPTQKNLFHIFVQDDHIFSEILHTLSGLETSSLTVVKTEDIHEYLKEMPLYAGVAGNGNSRQTHIIIATAERRLSNEIIRRIETVTGSLQQRLGVMVTVHELSYAAGSLEM